MTKRTILVVEDDDDCRAVLQDLLEMSGYVVVSCSGAEPARTGVSSRCSCSGAHHGVESAKAAVPVPALLLVDYRMPDATGGWVVQQLRLAGGALAAMPVVLTTGSADGHEIARALGVRSLEKPFDVSRLLELVRSLVAEA